VQIDEEGYPLFSGLRVQDKQFGKNLIAGIQRAPGGRTFITHYENEDYILEAFDQPLVVQMVIKHTDGDWEIELPYGIRKKLILSSLTADEWDRFHGRTAEDVPFVFSRKAQNAFFNLVTEFNDDGFFIGDGFHEVLPYWQSHKELHTDKTWTEIYSNKEERPGWDMEKENPILREAVPQLKIPKSRILVLGCGRGHDANYFAQLGHIVTAVDFSPEAIGQAKQLYPENDNLKFVTADVFHLPENFERHFDIVFDHTLFCAVDPAKRNALVKVYRQCLHDQGLLFAIFFTMDHMVQPPFGGTEWEYRERLKKSFQFLYWTRWHGETVSRRPAGSELIVYARKI
jgi:SAM-dependent methyltransferase